MKESNSMLLEIKDGKSHFLTRKNIMHDKIIRLSLSYPEETIYAECHWDTEYYDRIKYFFEYKNGNCKEIGIKPGYVFYYSADIFCNQNQYQISAFQNHVIKYLERLDLVKEHDGEFKIDKLNNVKDRNGFQSYITITVEDDLYKWTATKKWISWIEVAIEKKEPRVYREKEFEDKSSSSEGEEYGDLPF
ncbi:MAG: hypothetical protein IH594_09260 [Bacteroidales bacterium]|nr:hypothetical protein [Bacteroidales bacterium]